MAQSPIPLSAKAAVIATLLPFLVDRRKIRLREVNAKNRHQGVTKRCRLSWLTNGALVYEPKCGGLQVSANEYSCAHGGQINFGDLTPYLTYGRHLKKLTCKGMFIRVYRLEIANFLRTFSYVGIFNPAL